jgi:hypothetical protein
MATSNGDATEVRKRKIHRSPSYPVLSLTEALERARKIYEEEKRSAATASVLQQDMGYTVGTGPAGRAISALKQYGLLDEKDGQFTLSDSAFTLLQLSNGSPEYQTALKETSLKPAIFHEVLANYNGNLPSDTNLRDYLIRVKKFNPDSVVEFIRVLRQTVELAKPDDWADHGNEAFGEPPPMENTQGQQKPAIGAPAAGELPYFRFTLKGATVEFRASAPLSKEHFELIKAHLKALNPEGEE